MLDLSTLGLSPEQIARRRRGIGGSDAHHIISGDWEKLWEIKTGRSEYEDLSDILAVMMGIYTEPLNLAWYAKQTGRPVTRCGEQVTHPKYPFLGVTLDGYSVTEGGYPAPVNAKHVAQDNLATELRYMAQGTHEALCTGCDHFMFSMFVGNNKWVLTEHEVDPFFAEEYIGKCGQFWYYVETGERPPLAEPLPVPPPRQLRTIDMTGNNQFAECAHEWLRLRGPAKAFETAAKSMKSMVEPDVGLVTGYNVQIKRGRNDALYISEVKQ